MSTSDKSGDESLERSLVRRLATYIETGAKNPAHWQECRLRYEATAYLNAPSSAERAPIQAHSKSEYRRLTAQGANVVAPASSERASVPDALAAALCEDVDYDELEREQLGDADKGTGIYEAVTRISRERRMDWRTVPWEELPDLEKEAMADAIQEVFAVPVLPAGWALVPTVPTPEMYAEGERAKETGSDAQGVYIRMLDTAPQPPACDPSSYFAASEKPATEDQLGIQWRDPSTAEALLVPELDETGAVDGCVVRLDCAHEKHDGGPYLRQAWYDMTQDGFVCSATAKLLPNVKWWAYDAEGT